MENLADLTPEQLEAILGTDYEVILADALRQKAEAEARANERREIGQVGDGQVFFDPAGAIENVITRRRAGKEATKAQEAIDKALGDQKTGRRTYAEVLLGRGNPTQPPVGAVPRMADASLPPQAMPPGPPQEPQGAVSGPPPVPSPPPAPKPAPMAPPAPVAPPTGPMAGQYGQATPGDVPPLPQGTGGRTPVAPGFVEALIAKLRGR